MKRIFGLLILMLLLSCKSSESQIRTHVEFLSSDDIQGRATGSNGIERSAHYIASKFKDFGVQPYFNTYRDEFIAKGIEAFNVVGFIEGNDPDLKNEFIIIGAHYDHVGTGKSERGKRSSTALDTIANGANDNASGTATVMAIGKHFAQNKTNKRSILLTLFSAEELGLLGSEHLAKRLKKENLDLYTMINFEMTGVPFPDRDYVAFVSGYHLSNMAAKINEYTNSNLIGESVEAKKFDLFKRSDNYPFYEEFGIPCQTISSCDLTNYDYYHHVDDETDKLDYVHMTNLVNQLIPAFEKICNTTTKEIKMN
ncbi:MAG: M20/M25/M40 family metallo-hydrolase [Bacteroidia bacterium]|nr:M20/M25/M40 family metallo-hydrolase [Bacteroidia bacterium]